MAFFQDIAQKFGLIGDLAKQTVKTIQAQKQEADVTAKLKAKQVSLQPAASPTPAPQGFQFFGDVMNKIQPKNFTPQAIAPSLPPVVTEETPFVKQGKAIREEVRTQISEPLVRNLPFGIGERLTATPDQVQQIRDKYTGYSFKDLGKDAANLVAEITVNPLARIGLTGQHLITGENPGAGPGIGFKDAKTFEPSTIGSYKSIYDDNVKNGDSPVTATLKTGVVLGFDAMLGYGLGKDLIPSVKLAARNLPESLLYKMTSSDIKVDEILGTLRGDKVTDAGNAFIKNLTPDEKKALFGLSRAYEEAGQTTMTTTKKDPNALGEFAGVKPTEGVTEIRPDRQLPGFMSPDLRTGAIGDIKGEPVGFGEGKPGELVGKTDSQKIEDLVKVGFNRAGVAALSPDELNKIHIDYARNPEKYDSENWKKMLEEDAANKKNQVEATPVTSPTTPQGNFEVPGNLDKKAEELYGKKFLDLKASERDQVLGPTMKGDRIVISNNEPEILKKFSKAGYNVPDVHFDNLIFGGKRDGLFTDSFMLITDKNVANELNDALISKYRSKEIKQLTLHGGSSHAEASAIADEDIKQKMANAAFPETKQLIPKGDYELLNQPLGAKFEPTGTHIVYKTKEGQAVFDTKYIAQIEKSFPGAEKRYYGPNKPMAFYKDGELKGLLMPIDSEGMEPFPERNIKPAEVKPVETPAKKAALPKAKKEPAPKTRLDEEMALAKQGKSEYWKIWVESNVDAGTVEKIGDNKEWKDFVMYRLIEEGTRSPKEVADEFRRENLPGPVDRGQIKYNYEANAKQLGDKRPLVERVLDEYVAGHAYPSKTGLQYWIDSGNLPAGIEGKEVMDAFSKSEIAKLTPEEQRTIKPTIKAAEEEQTSEEQLREAGMHPDQDTTPASQPSPESPKAEIQAIEKTKSPSATQGGKSGVSKSSLPKKETKKVSYKDSITQPIHSEQEAKKAFRAYELGDEEGDEILPGIKITIEGSPASYIDGKDITGFSGQFRDVYRNFKQVFGENTPKIKEVLLDKFDAAKGRYVDIQKKFTDELYQKIVVDLGIKKGSKEDAAIMDYGEKVKTIEEITKELGEKTANKIVEADKWFREKYDEMLREINETRADIYPNSPEKQIPVRADYYRHYQELGAGAEELRNIFESPSGISPKMAGISSFTKPKSKFLSFAQKRLGFASKRSAIGGFLDYVPAYAYGKEIDPFIGKFRGLAKRLAEGTEDTGKVNNFIEFLQDFANDLSGKTNAADRYVQKLVGRKPFKFINWLNRRIKANTVLGNLSSSVSQIFNVPQGLGHAKQYAIPGAVKTFGGLFKENPEMAKSSFIKERYHNSMYDKFDKGMIHNTRKFAAWITGVLDEVGTKFTWNSLYLKAKGKGIANPIKYADDITRGMVAGRGVGEVPLGQKSKLFQIIAPFQLEVGNAWWVMKDMVTEKQFGALILMLITSYLMNKVSEKVKGNDVVFDPIQATFDGAQSFSEEDNKWIGLEKFLGRMGGEVLSNVPVGQTFASMLPDQLPDWMGGLSKAEVFGRGDPTRYGSGLMVSKGLADPLFKILPPLGGGQLEKTIQGSEALLKGRVESASGKTNLFPVAPTLANKLKLPLFGKYAGQEGWNYFTPTKEERDLTALNKKEAEATADLKNNAEDAWDKLKTSSKEEAINLIKEWNQTNPDIIPKINQIVKDEARGLTKVDRQVLNLGVSDGFRAKYIVDKIKGSSKEEAVALIKDYVSKKIITPEVQKQIIDLLAGK